MKYRDDERFTFYNVPPGANKISNPEINNEVIENQDPNSKNSINNLIKKSFVSKSEEKLKTRRIDYKKIEIPSIMSK